MKKTRKTYECPMTQIFSISTVLLGTSEKITATENDSSIGIGYAGIDTDGSQTPGARRNNVWGDDEEEEF